MALSSEGEAVCRNATLLGTAAVTADPDRMDRASGWIFDRYADDDDGGDDRDPSVDPDATAWTDGGVPADSALVVVRVGSASWHVN